MILLVLVPDHLFREIKKFCLSFSWDWTEDASSMTLVMTYPESLPDANFVSISSIDSLLKLRVFVPSGPRVHNFHISKC